MLDLQCKRRPSRHPFEVMLMAALVIGGVGNLIFEGSLVLNAAFPAWTVAVANWLFIVSGAAALLGAYLRDVASSLLLERTALVGAGLTCLIYGILLVVIRGTAAVVIGPIMILVGVACAWRIHQVNQEIAHLAEALQAVRKSDDGG